MNCRESRLWLFLLLYIVDSACAIDRLSASIFKFIYSHENLCGDQFGDLAWMPAHDHCDLNCDLLTEICQLSSDKLNHARQRCLRLPRDCSNALSLHLYSLGLESRRSEPKSDGITISGTSNSNRHFGFSTSKPFIAKTLQPHLNIRHLNEEIVSTTRSPENELQNQFNEFQHTFNEFFADDEEEHETIDPQVTLMSQEPSSTTQMEEYAEAEANDLFVSDNNIFEQTDIATTQPFEYQEVSSTDSRLEMPSTVPTPPSEVNIFGPPFVDKLHSSPTLPFTQQSELKTLPTSLDDFARERQNKPSWSWKQMSDRLRRPWSLQNRPEQDLSHRCCQWALDGLCDRSWQRVRVLCPKSCGTVVCSSSDGALSCSRAIDVDVVDCYEKRKSNLQGISSRFYESEEGYSNAEKYNNRQKNRQNYSNRDSNSNRDSYSMKDGYNNQQDRRSKDSDNNKESFSNQGIFPTSERRSKPKSYSNQDEYTQNQMNFGFTTKSNVIPPSYFPTTPKLNVRMGPLQRAFAVESEIKKFKPTRTFG
ncbi:unnamed protein product [Bursaphelenchus okinawaensis]|uniref:ShKT domain-containing protein n=1 Tax=Bursaphelenchus okinawaensis TaxID=465554 RepID=A0A811KHX2_9BILA|nr:unnamed protein product [Bursaphelenchus okinawaensis]CAG9102751.1 unnamed protein product [Bursaphelenchus okinawaensis]